MWFRNLRIYTLADDFQLPEELASPLTEHQFKPCGRNELASFGWSSPFGPRSEELFHKIGDQYLFCARKEEKVLPASVVNAQLEEQIEAIESDQGRRVVGKEKQSLKEDLVHQLLPQAFTRFKLTWGMLDMRHRIVVVDASASAQAEDFLGLLRSTLGSLPVKPWFSEQPTELYFTQWLKQGSLPGDFVFGDEAELRSSDEEGGIIRCKNHELTSPEITAHLEHGKQVTKLAVEWQERITMVLEQDMAIKRFKATDVLLDDQDKLVDATPEQKIDADFALLSGELTELFPELVRLFSDEISVD
ncbi:recombination-associated protein RdgC [Pseudidiomarina terrestris]|uniref:Recombination-associated protein RdgC n=1 Tax=Pseudidiomarina terrestris TaxID=2820060 RepID=A0ABT8MIY2_9GAMM|nr:MULTISPECIES: recombination-associated protein RdgC [unclassified Pseudidiomarina]MDN7127457.1 recombination-associated protein RdgC [Pseudidiomarina sp. 1APR75-33.1]MDN7129901.1 recombination-associated protein RdgC [Pseudidiomarina sp. 1APR75-15]MDN7136067.1 recombination-associated protein RdgC [Pseudidiomarina sp. 1ASP75-5]MDN7138408.1 recombination-associated protein RdgC [Pseudidiomarina sp. 1ASP75-14]MEA3588994.1 recombination-associated protein RdgC [Pseudidiomarina sp. 1APP75-27a]